MISDAWWERNRTWAPYPLTVLMIGLFLTGRWAVMAYVELIRLLSGGTTTVMAVSGPGGNAFVAGMRNGLPGGVVTSFTAPFVLASERLRDHFGVRTLGWMPAAPLGTFLIATLAAAITLAAS
ncbi:hypothetical protein [Actinoplanes philippinensis]|uniref:hypothetical protein n=1 Tax=Actinoplanes philippinensis TaxID=35752 RepID=UPI003400B115